MAKYSNIKREECTGLWVGECTVVSSNLPLVAECNDTLVPGARDDDPLRLLVENGLLVSHHTGLDLLLGILYLDPTVLSNRHHLGGREVQYSLSVCDIAMIK